MVKSLPQWNGVRIQHPMDPRIDLSTVGYIQTSSLSAYPRNVDIPTRQPTGQADGVENTVGSSEPSPTPSIDQYMNLMEVNTSRMQGHIQLESISCLIFSFLGCTAFLSCAWDYPRILAAKIRRAEQWKAIFWFCDRIIWWWPKALHRWAERWGTRCWLAHLAIW